MNTTRPTRTLRVMLLMAAVQAVVATVVIGGLLVASGWVPDQQEAAQTQPIQTLPAKGSPADLIQRHDCWTGEAPAGVIPGHVVVTIDGHVAPTYGGPALTGQALDQLFGGKDAGLTVHAFCR